MGRYLTDVVSTEWLRQPVPGRGKPGMFDVRVPEESLPEGHAEGLARAQSSDDALVVFDKEY